MGGGGGGGDSTSAPATASASASATTTRVMEALKCPRCDSSNTKFCYYNNYSLSQPRHFCKACKRYWTRGGTLRNVPVGGGCRKNKRSKKPSSSSSSDPPPLPPPIPSLNLPNPSSADLNSFFYGLPNTTTTSSDMNLNSSFPNNIHVPCTAYDLQPQMSSLALLNPSNNLHDDEYPSGFGNHLAQLQHEYSLFGSSLSSSTVASLLVSSLKHQQPKKMDELQAYLPYQDLQANGSLGFLKQVKAEGEEANAMMSNNNYNYNNRMEWQVQAPFENPFDTISSAAAQEPSSLYWNSAIGAWPDATNCGSSVAPLI